MSTEATETSNPTQFTPFSDTLALWVVGEDDGALSPDINPDILPAGWQWTGDMEDYQFADGDWREVYILEREQ
jgi:hypothetical protein